MRELPLQVRRLVDDALADVRNHPGHQCNWRYRQALYTELGSPDDLEILRTRVWLSLFADQRVLPIFIVAVEVYLEIAFTEAPKEYFAETEEWASELRTLPSRLLNLTKEWLYGKASDDELRSLIDDGGNAFLNGTKMASNGDLAGFATYKAAAEAIRCKIGHSDPFEHASLHVKSIVTDAMGHDQTYRSFTMSPIREGAIGGDQFTDEDWAGIDATGDTAGTAAVAFACGGESVKCDAEKLLEFWTWWFTEALPAAWARGHQESFN